MMHRGGVAALLVLTAPIGVAAQSAPAPVSVTLFASGQVLVRRTLSRALPEGVSTHTLALGALRPESFAALDPGTRVTSVRASEDVSEETLLRRHVGDTFAIDTGASGRGTRRAMLVALDPERWQWVGDSGVRFGRLGRIVWPRDMVPTMLTSDVTFVSDRARRDVHVMYQTEGATWSAAYQLFLGADARLTGAALIESGPLDFADAEIQLEAGNIGRGPAPAPKGYRDAVPRLQVATSGFEEAATTAGASSSEAVGESHLYTVPGRSTFTPGVSFTTALFDPASVRPVRRYVVSGALSWFGGLPQQSSETNVPVAVVYHAVRKLGTPFGDLPLPAGYVGIFDTDAAGRVQLIGQGSIDHTAPGQELVVDAGTSFDVTARRTQTDYSESRVPANPPRSGVFGTLVQAGYRVVLANARDSAVTVEVREERGGDWSVLDSSVPAQRESSTRVVFRVPVAARDSTVLTYRVRASW